MCKKEHGVLRLFKNEGPSPKHLQARRGYDACLQNTRNTNPGGTSKKQRMILHRQDNRNWGYGFRRERNLWWGGHERLHWGEKMVEKGNLK